MPYEDPIVRVGLLQRALQAPGGVFRQRCSLMGGWCPDWLMLAAPSLEGMQYCRGLREAEHRRPGAGEAFLNLRDNESTFMEPGAMRQAGASLPAYSRNQRRWRSRVWHEEWWPHRGAVVPHYGGASFVSAVCRGARAPTGLVLAAPSLEGMCFCMGCEAEHWRPEQTRQASVCQSGGTLIDAGTVRQEVAMLPADSRNQRRWRSRVCPGVW